VVICLERGANLHMDQLMPLPLTVSCFSKIQIGFTFLVPAHPGSPGKRAVKRVCVCVAVQLRMWHGIPLARGYALTLCTSSFTYDVMFALMTSWRQKGVYSENGSAKI